MKQRSKVEKRCGIERRVFCYTSVLPERRSGIDRRIIQCQNYESTKILKTP